MSDNRGLVVPYSYKSRYIKVSSDDRTNISDTNSNFSVQIPSEGGIVDAISACYIKSAYCQNVFPNVQSYANTVFISNNTLTYQIMVPPGQYSITTFITALQSAINTAIAPDTVVITQNSQQKLVFTFSAGTPYLFIYAPSTMAKILGLTANASDTTPNVVTMQSIPNLIGTTNVYIRSRAISTSLTIDSNGGTPVVEILNMNAPFGFSAYSNYKPDFNYIQYEPYEVMKSFRTIDIQLTNDEGNQLEWIGGINTNFNFEMIIKIYYN